MAGRIRKGNYKSDYTLIPNETAQKKDLSWKAKGLLFYLLSLPPDWIIYKKEIHKNALDGYDSTNSAFTELESKGYIVSDGSAREGGMFAGKDYYVYPTPMISTDGENPDRSEGPPIGEIHVGTDGENPDLQSKQVITPYSRNKTKETLRGKSVKSFIKPTLNDVIEFFKSKGFNSDFASMAFEYYDSAEWKDSRGNKVINWKQKMIVNWINSDKADNYKIKENDLFSEGSSSIKMVY